MSDETVELHPASFWDCPSCGNENLIRHIIDESPPLSTPPGTPIQYEQDEDGAGVFWVMPRTVKCKRCLQEFLNQDYEAVANPSDDEPEIDDDFEDGDEDDNSQDSKG